MSSMSAVGLMNQILPESPAVAGKLEKK
jgi:hypothetical protein